MTLGIYKITNLINGKFYIGSAVNIQNRWTVHLWCLRKNKHHSIHLQNVWNKYGEQNFLFEVIEEVHDKEKLIEREQHYIDILHPEYNICKVAGSPLGVKHSEETRQKMSERMKGENNPNFGKHLSEKEKQNLSNIFKGRQFSIETRQKLSDSMKGEKNYNYNKHPSEETRQKLSQLGKGEKNHFYGKKHSDETKLKMSKFRKGKIYKHTCKLTWDVVREIRLIFDYRNDTFAQFARKYGVSESAIAKIIKGKTWIE